MRRVVCALYVCCIYMPIAHIKKINYRLEKWLQLCFNFKNIVYVFPRNIYVRNRSFQLYINA